MSNLPFVIVIPGRAPITEFECDNDIYHIDIQNPTTVPNICLTLVSPLPDNYAVTLSFSAPPYTQMQYLGAISNNRPSDIFSTGFPLKAQFKCVPSIKLCIQGQQFNDICQLVSATDGKKQYSILVAQNLYNFMMSYNKSDLLINNVGDYLVIPSDCLHKWMKKFQEKYQKDPDFILRTTVN